MTGLYLYSIAIFLLIFSAAKDMSKTKVALLKAWKSFNNLIPQVLSIMIFVGISLAYLSPTTISVLIGTESGIRGIIVALVIGSITLIPSFVAFPLAGALLKGGAGYPQIAAFVSSLMAVGVVTIPLEIKYFNKSAVILRNGLFLLVALIFTIVIGWVM